PRRAPARAGAPARRRLPGPRPPRPARRRPAHGAAEGGRATTRQGRPGYACQSASRRRSIMKVLVLNGPNLGRLGTREPEIYGHTTYADLVTLCEKTGHELDLDVTVRQTDHEGEMIGWLHEAAEHGHAVVLNAG